MDLLKCKRCKEKKGINVFPVLDKTICKKCLNYLAIKRYRSTPGGKDALKRQSARNSKRQSEARERTKIWLYIEYLENRGYTVIKNPSGLASTG